MARLKRIASLNQPIMKCEREPSSNSPNVCSNFLPLNSAMILPSLGISTSRMTACMAAVVVFGFLLLYISSSVSLSPTDTIRLTCVWNSVSPSCGEVNAAPRKQGVTLWICPLSTDSLPCQCTYFSSRFQPKSTLTLQRTVSPSGAIGVSGPFMRAKICPFLTIST